MPIFLPEIKVQALPGKTILFGVLNWGLGHAARSIPLIKKLKENGHRLILASDGTAGELLQQAFPGLPYERLPAFNITYASNPNLFKWHLLLQGPHFLKTLRQELRYTKKLSEKYRADCIISDNRPGFRHKKIPSVYITHQLRILSGLFTPLTTTFHYGIYKKFDRIWVPDYAGNPNLSGILSHPPKIPGKIQYIGPVSRFDNMTRKKPAGTTYDWLIIISGPEKQRSILEKNILNHKSVFGEKVALVRGTQAPSGLRYPSSWKIIDLAGTETLSTLIRKSQKILSRSGYTSIMDWNALRKPAVLIPTPGQTEQEYLAAYLDKQKIFPGVDQRHLEQIPSINLDAYRFHIDHSAFSPVDYKNPCL